MINKHDAENDEVYHDTLETIENPKDLVIDKEKALDSGIDEDEEYYDPMTVEPVPGAIDDYGNDKPSSRTTEPDPRDPLSPVLTPSTNFMGNMRFWEFSSNKCIDMRSDREITEITILIPAVNQKQYQTMNP